MTHQTTRRQTLATLGATLGTPWWWPRAAQAQPVSRTPRAERVQPPAGVLARTVVNGLETPWGLAFLPDGRALITERTGQMRIVDVAGKRIVATLTGLPAVRYEDQGGLLDVAVDPDFERTPWVYWSYAEPGTGAESALNSTAVARGRLVGQRLEDIAVIFRQSPKVPGAGHFGSRLVFDRQKHLFITLGDRQRDNPASPGKENAQNVRNHLGKIVRVQRDGRPAPGNPDFGPQAAPGLWSIGHRNVQGAALHPQTGALWVSEHGPQGGDELNLVRAGANHGWPLRSYGCPYGSRIGDECRVAEGAKHAPQYTEPLTYWAPLSVAPSGMAFYTGNRIPSWRGSLFVGSLAGLALWRLTVTHNSVVAREALFTGELGRIRDVSQGPDGWLYLINDDGKLVRIGS